MINTKNKYEELHNEADDKTIESLYMLNEYRGSTYICDAISERVKEVNEEQADRLDAMDTIIDNNNRVEDIESEVLEILGIEK